jgi:hypothetical protein
MFPGFLVQGIGMGGSRGGRRGGGQQSKADSLWVRGIRRGSKRVMEVERNRRGGGGGGESRGTRCEKRRVWGQEKRTERAPRASPAQVQRQGDQREEAAEEKRQEHAGVVPPCTASGSTGGNPRVSLIMLLLSPSISRDDHHPNSLFLSHTLVLLSLSRIPLFLCLILGIHPRT